LCWCLSFSEHVLVNALLCWHLGLQLTSTSLFVVYRFCLSAKLQHVSCRM